MAGTSANAQEDRVLLLAPTGRDAALAETVLTQAGLWPLICHTSEELCDELAAGAGAALLSEEALSEPVVWRLLEELGHQPPWSDFPLVIFTHAQDSFHPALESLGNVTFLERPVRVATLVSAVRAALRARRRQYQVRDLLRRLEQSDRQKDEFLAMLAHELRNPLGAISNAVQLLKRFGPEEPRLRRALETIDRQVRHQSRLVDDLLNVTRITRGKISLRLERLDLVCLVRESLEDHRSAIQEAGLTLARDLPDQPVWVGGDPTRLAQVLDNLLTNAVKFSDQGGAVTVHVGAAPEREQASLTVRDTGVGISPEMLPHIWETFTQADHSLDRSRGGLGLGLALVKGLIRLHGGEVEAESAGPGRGAAFTVRLPLVAEGRRSIANRLSASAPAPPRRILLIEDNQDAADTLRDVLELLGHQVAVAYSGREGLEAARQLRPEVVLCDLGLPGMDGYAVAAALRQDPATAEALLIAVSGYGQEADRRRSREAGFVRHLTKPVDPDDLEPLLRVLPTHPAFPDGPPSAASS